MHIDYTYYGNNPHGAFSHSISDKINMPKDELEVISRKKKKIGNRKKKLDEDKQPQILKKAYPNK